MGKKGKSVGRAGAGGDRAHLEHELAADFEAGVLEGLDDGEVGVVQARVLADQADFNLGRGGKQYSG